MAPFAFVAVLLSGLAVLQLTSAGTLEEKKSFFAKFHPSIVFNPAVYDLPYVSALPHTGVGRMAVERAPCLTSFVCAGIAMGLGPTSQGLGMNKRTCI